MKIPADAIIPDEKLIFYLLVFREKDDKSKFLAQAGFTPETSESLREAIKLLIASEKAIEDGQNQYGIFYRVEGNLKGANEKNLAVVTIWIRWYLDNSFHFVTLKPRR